jgi:hypothetical protein
MQDGTNHRCQAPLERRAPRNLRGASLCSGDPLPANAGVLARCASSTESSCVRSTRVP